jgi:hypothetical protein
MNKDRLKIFDTDILPKNPNDKTRKLAHEDDDFFENMGKRGTKKKNIDKTFYFENVTDPIYLILTNSNHKLRTLLSLHAIELLNDNNELFKNNKYLSSKYNNDPIKDNLNNMISLMSSSPIDNSINSLSQKQSSLSIDNFISSDDDDDDDESVSELEISVIEITTKKGRLLWYESETSIVYNPEEPRKGGMGKLIKVPSKYSTIKMNNNEYTIIIEILHKKYGLINCCVLTDKLFNENFDHIGIRKKNKYEKNTYDLEFFDEI